MYQEHSYSKLKIWKSVIEIGKHVKKWTRKLMNSTQYNKVISDVTLTCKIT